jgi:hypothetical protein
MICKVKLNKEEIKEFQNASVYYKTTFNLHREWLASCIDKLYPVRALRRICGYKANKFMYCGIVNHANESTKELKHNYPIYFIRLGNVYLCENQFLFNDILFTFPELLDYLKDKKCKHSFVKNIKLRLVGNTLSASFDIDDITPSLSRFITLYHHHWDYKMDFNPENPCFSLKYQPDRKFNKLNNI